MTDPMEKQWIMEAQEGSDAAFGRLVGAYQKKVFGFLLSYAGREDAADELTQETFFKAWKGLKSFRAESAFQTWLFQIGLNTLRSWARREKIRRLRERTLAWFGDEDEPRDPLDQVADQRSDADPRRGVEGREIREKLQAAVAVLPPQEKTVFLLRHDQGLALADIAQAMKLAEGTVKAHLFHALTKVRRKMEALS